MPHDYSEPQIQRTQRGKVTIVKLVQTCLACGVEREVYHEPPHLPTSDRIKVYDL